MLIGKRETLEEIALNEKYGQLRVFVAAGATDLSMDGTGGTMSILYVAHSKEEAVASLVASVMGPLTRLKRGSEEPGRYDNSGAHHTTSL